MGSASSPSFIHELKLVTTIRQRKIMNRRLNAARQIYNACLGEALKRLKLMRDSKLYQSANKTPKKNKTRKDKFKEAKKTYGFSEYALHKYLTSFYSNTWLTQHVDSLTAQKIATRAFKAVEQYAYGKRGKPRFRGENRISSVEGKNNAAGIRFLDGKIIWSTKGGEKLILSVNYDLKDKAGLEAYALACITKYVRLVRRKIKGIDVWYVQLIQSGTPYIKEKNKASINNNNIVGLDIGPSTIALVSNKKAVLQAFCEEIEDYRKDIAKIQRKMSRSQRAMNTDNFEKNIIQINSTGKKITKQGKVKKGAKTWQRSNNYIKLQNKIREQQRKMAATRKCSHGYLANNILKLGNIIKTEKLSYKSWQKNFGKSVGFRAPGLFLNILRQKAASAAGEVIEFNTRTTALSQTCHCGSKRAKKLKERWHNCTNTNCDVTAQRDLYSAFLARFVKGDKLDSSQAANAWAGAGVLLEQAVSNLNKTAIGKARLASFGLGQSQSGLSAKEESVQNDTLDVVAGTCA